MSFTNGSAVQCETKDFLIISLRAIIFYYPRVSSGKGGEEEGSRAVPNISRGGGGLGETSGPGGATLE